MRGDVPGLDRGAGTLLAAGDLVQHLAEAVHVQLEQGADRLQWGGGYPEFTTAGNEGPRIFHNHEEGPYPTRAFCLLKVPISAIRH